MAVNLSGTWSDAKENSPVITDNDGTLTVTSGGAPWQSAYGAWGRLSENKKTGNDKDGNSAQGIMVFVYDTKPNLITDTERFTYENGSLVFDNGYTWSPQS